jgi:hypothetical protein
MRVLAELLTGVSVAFRNAGEALQTLSVEEPGSEVVSIVSKTVEKAAEVVDVSVEMVSPSKVTAAAVGSPQKDTAEKAEETPEVTKEQVKDKLLELSRSGKKVQAREVITKRGADTLSQIDKSEYPAMLAELEVLLSG